MRTTVTLDSDVEQLVKAAMSRGDKSFKQVINETLRRGLQGSGEEGTVPFEVKPRPMNLRPGHDPARLSELDDEAEGAEYRRKLERLARHRIHDRS